ncbi:hypothetical protein J31TS4_22790 [Paenibacillus sp. J31TS4]|nr:hypothetical protein J31TS4_22790 [Paenibacillus sp. J31TS4]
MGQEAKRIREPQQNLQTPYLSPPGSRKGSEQPNPLPFGLPITAVNKPPYPGGQTKSPPA